MTLNQSIERLERIANIMEQQRNYSTAQSLVKAAESALDLLRIMASLKLYKGEDAELINSVIVELSGALRPFSLGGDRKREV